MQDVAFLLVLTGLLLLYCEAIWIGRIVFGVAGSVLILAGFSFRWPLPVNPMGLWLVAGSLVGFALEARFRTKFIAGIAGSVLLSSGAWTLGVSPVVAFASSALFGAITVALAWIARKARENKRSDL